MTTPYPNYKTYILHILNRKTHQSATFVFLHCRCRYGNTFPAICRFYFLSEFILSNEPKLTFQISTLLTLALACRPRDWRVFDVCFPFGAKRRSIKIL
jgi:hypothetical protein